MSAETETKVESTKSTEPTTAQASSVVPTTQASTQQNQTVEETKSKEAKTISVGEDEYEVDESGYVKFSAASLKKRMNRYSKSTLKEAFGTDDVEDLKARLDEHGKLKAKSEDERRKQLAKEEQLAEDLKKERERADKAERRATELAEEKEYRAADKEVRKVAERYVKPGKFSKLATIDFGEYVEDLDEDEVKKLKPKDIDAWFRQYAIDNPELSKSSKKEDPKDETKSKTEIRKPITHGAGGEPSHTPIGVTGGKTPKPGRVDSMNDKEYREYKRSQGLS